MNLSAKSPRYTSQIVPDDGGRILIETFKTGRVLDLSVTDEIDSEVTAIVTLTPDEALTLGRFLIGQSNELRAGRK